MSIDSIKWVLLGFIVVCGNPRKIMPRYWDFPCSHYLSSSLHYWKKHSALLYSIENQ